MNNSQYRLADELPSCWFFINWSLVSFQRCVCVQIESCCLSWKPQAPMTIHTH